MFRGPSIERLCVRGCFLKRSTSVAGLLSEWIRISQGWGRWILNIEKRYLSIPIEPVVVTTESYCEKVTCIGKWVDVVETPGTSSSPKMTGCSGLLRSIVHSGSIFRKVTVRHIANKATRPDALIDRNISNFPYDIKRIVAGEDKHVVGRWSRFFHPPASPCPVVDATRI